MTQASYEMVLLFALVMYFMEYYEESISFDSLYKAMKKCCRNLRWKDSVIGYEHNGLRNTYKLRQEILKGTYVISKYQHFIIHEPKEREIVATRFRDRQFQMSLCQSGLYNDFIEHFICDNPACQTGKGTDYTLNRLTAHMRRYFTKYGSKGWVLKCDIRHFFPETSHEIAKEAVIDHIKDAQVASKIFAIIDSFGGDKGIALGSQISQLIELAVLNKLDHFIKERLRIKYYVRYMDDMVLIHPDKEYLKYCLTEIKSFLQINKYELNDKTTIYPLSNGVKLMHWRFVLTNTGAIKRLLPSSKMGKQRRKLKKIYQRELNGTLPKGSARLSLESWLANAKRGDTYHQRCKMISYYYDMKRRMDDGLQH